MLVVTLTALMSPQEGKASLAFSANGVPQKGSASTGSHASGSAAILSSPSPANSGSPVPTTSADAAVPSLTQAESQTITRVQQIPTKPDVLDKSVSMLGLAMQAMSLLIALITIVVAVAAAVGLFEARRWKILRRDVEEYSTGVRAVRDNALAARNRLTVEFGSLDARITYTPSEDDIDLADELGQVLTLLELVGVPLSSRDYLNRATDLFYKKRIQRCLRAIEKSIELDPTSAMAWNAKSFTLMHLKNYRAALTAADEALKLDERAANAWDNRGSCLLKLGYLDEALEAIERAKRISPLADEIWYNLACLYAVKRRPEEALSTLPRPLSLSHEIGYLLKLNLILLPSV
ncbi:MAG TPA: tetratricopeptide repeat protein [Thermoanaerobaculia bacterium]|nr:tetratricopeptide repeat protein [Thermoanaerobaculia bacterium]